MAPYNQQVIGDISDERMIAERLNPIEAFRRVMLDALKDFFSQTYLDGDQHCKNPFIFVADGEGRATTTSALHMLVEQDEDARVADGRHIVTIDVGDKLMMEKTVLNNAVTNTLLSRGGQRSVMLNTSILIKCKSKTWRAAETLSILVARFLLEMREIIQSKSAVMRFDNPEISAKLITDATPSQSLRNERHISFGAQMPYTWMSLVTPDVLRGVALKEPPPNC